MNTLTAETKFDMLPQNLKEEVVDFIDFLIEKASKKTEPAVRQPGSAKGKIWMSPDFDEPLEDFKDYM